MKNGAIKELLNYPIGWVGDEVPDACAQLHTYLRALGNHLETVRAQYRLRADHEHEKRLKELDPSKDPSPDYETRKQDEYFYQIEKEGYERLREIEDRTILQMTWNSFIVSCWATYEMYFERFAEYVQSKKNIKLAPSQVKGDKISRLNTYFSRVLNISLSLDDQDSNYLGNLYLVRNAVAHGNGSIDEVYSDKKTKIREFILSNPHLDLEGRYLRFDEPFCEEALTVVTRSLLIIKESQLCFESIPIVTHCFSVEGQLSS
jgi:hypothetical protein